MVTSCEASTRERLRMTAGTSGTATTWPGCPGCPARKACGAAKEGDPERFPRLPKKRKTIALELEAGLVRRGDRFLLERIEGFDFLKGLWLFPLATVDKAGIEGRLARLLGTGVEKTGELKAIRHSITFRRLSLRPLLLKTGRFSLKDRPSFRWARLDELGSALPVSSLCLKVARRLQEAG